MWCVCVGTWLNWKPLLVLACVAPGMYMHAATQRKGRHSSDSDFGLISFPHFSGHQVCDPPGAAADDAPQQRPAVVSLVQARAAYSVSLVGGSTP